MTSRLSVPESTRMFTANALTWDPFTNQGHILPVTVCLRPPYTRDGELTLMGTMGPQMKESMGVAVTLARQTLMAKNMQDIFRKCDISITIPDDPQYMYDGTSAGLATYSAVIGVMCGWESNPSIAMTGEVASDGKVCVVRGVQEKLKLAHEHNMHTVFVPAGNTYTMPGSSTLVIKVSRADQMHELGEVEYNEDDEEEDV